MPPEAPVTIATLPDEPLIASLASGTVPRWLQSVAAPASHDPYTHTGVLSASPFRGAPRASRRPAALVSARTRQSARPSALALRGIVSVR